MAEEERKRNNDLLLAYFKKDWLIIAVCLVAVLVCLVAYLNTAIVLDKCNANCQEAFNKRCEGAKAPIYNTGEALPVLNISNWGGNS